MSEPSEPPSAPPSRIPSLDGLRAVSIALVLIGHAEHTIAFGRGTPVRDWLFRIAGHGSLGVSIFFVISGFLITTLLLREKEAAGGGIRLGRFYLRRVLRIQPPFYAYLLVIAALGAIGAIPLRASALLKAGLFVWDYCGEDNWFLGHTWSLSVEEQFYLAWPLVLWRLTPRRAALVAIAIIAASPAVRLATYAAAPGRRGFIPVMLHTRADVLMCGCLAAIAYRAGRLAPLLRRIAHYRLHAVAAAFVLLVSPWLERRFAGAYLLPIGFTLEATAITVVLLWVVHHPGRGAGRVLNAAPLVGVGVLSYSLYLWQQLFLTPLNHTPLGRFPLNLVACFAAAAASYYLVERPVLRLREAWGGRAGGGRLVARGAAGELRGSATGATVK